MNASIILCTYNRADQLAIAVRSILQVRVPSDFTWELLIVDNNSRDSTRSVAESLVAESAGRVRYLFEPRQGKSVALNSGIRESKGDLLVFTDDDITVHPEWLSELAAAMQRFGCAGIGGRIVPVWTVPKPDWLEMDGPFRLMNAVVSFDLGEKPCPIETSALGANFAFKREVFATYGDFRKDLGPTVGSEIRGEDSEFCRRLIKAGERIMYAPSAIVYHPVEPHRTKKSYFEAWYLGRGRASVREAGIPAGSVRYFGVPRYLLLQFARNAAKSVLTTSAKLKFHHRLCAYETWGQILEARKAAVNGQ